MTQRLRILNRVGANAYAQFVQVAIIFVGITGWPRGLAITDTGESWAKAKPFWARRSDLDLQLIPHTDAKSIVITKLDQL